MPARPLKLTRMFLRLTPERCKRSWPFKKGRYLPLAADFNNFRKRTARETERGAAAQKEAFIRELLPIIDNLERALASDVSTSAEQTSTGRPDGDSVVYRARRPDRMR